MTDSLPSSKRFYLFDDTARLAAVHGLGGKQTDPEDDDIDLSDLLDFEPCLLIPL